HSSPVKMQVQRMRPHRRFSEDTRMNDSGAGIDVAFIRSLRALKLSAPIHCEVQLSRMSRRKLRIRKQDQYIHPGVVPEMGKALQIGDLMIDPECVGVEKKKRFSTEKRQSLGNAAA